MSWVLLNGQCILAVFRTLSDFTSPIWSLLSSVLPFVALGAACCLFDYLGLVYRDQRFPRAFVDNLAHGTIAAMCWLAACGLQSRVHVLEAIICGLIASAIDVDHFVMARSLKLSDATALNHRPFLHTTSVVVLVVPLLYVFSVKSMSSLKSLPYLFVIAVISHHLRDSHRRGLWVWPFGSTPPLPQWMYVTCTMVLPYLVRNVQTWIDIPKQVTECHQVIQI